MEQQKKQVPFVESRLRHNILEMPKEIRQASGIVIYGRRIKSLVFTTDLAVIKNCDADAVFAVYPFTPQQSISDAIIKASYIPVFCGVGGGTTQGFFPRNCGIIFVDPRPGRLPGPNPTYGGGIHMEQQKKQVPFVESRLRHNILEMPKEIRQASGIVIYGRRIKSLVFTTDLAVIKNCDADAVFAVYPFTPPAVHQ